MLWAWPITLMVEPRGSFGWMSLTICWTALEAHSGVDLRLARAHLRRLGGPDREAHLLDLHADLLAQGIDLRPQVASARLGFSDGGGGGTTLIQEPGQ